MKADDARPVEIYDTTLRDGAQAEDVSFSAEDKVMVAQKVDGLGAHFIEGGWPGANPKDIDFFRMIKTVPLKQAKVVAFGSTRRATNSALADPTLKAILDADTRYVTLFGKSWTLHVTDALGVSLKKNLELIEDSIAYLKGKGRQVFYDAEHFFDGYKANPDYALQTLLKAQAAGAERLLLCDTNGGTMPWEVKRIVAAIAREVRVPLGIHAHNDAEMAVANSLTAIQEGVLQVQGTINGIGERCGNANLSSIIPNLHFKMKMPSVTPDQLRKLRGVPLRGRDRQPGPAQAPALRGRLGLCAQRGRAHRRGTQEPDDLRARPPGSGRQSPADADLRLRRQEQPGGEGRGVSHQAAEEGPQGPGTPGDTQGPGEPGLPVRRGRGLVRALDAPDARQAQALL